MIKGAMLMFQVVASPAIFCHKGPARNKQIFGVLKSLMMRVSSRITV